MRYNLAAQWGIRQTQKIAADNVSRNCVLIANDTLANDDI